MGFAVTVASLSTVVVPLGGFRGGLVLGGFWKPDHHEIIELQRIGILAGPGGWRPEAPILLVDT